MEKRRQDNGRAGRGAGTRGREDRGYRKESGFREREDRGYRKESGTRGREDRGFRNESSFRGRTDAGVKRAAKRNFGPRAEENEGLETRLEGRNSIREAFAAGRTIDKLYVLDGCMDEPVQRIVSLARKAGTIISFVEKDKLDAMSETGVHQGVIAQAAAAEYCSVDDILALAEEKGEDPFLILLDDIEDPHNLGAIIRTANAAGAHGVVIPKRHAATLTATVAKASAGAVHYTKIAKVTNLASEVENLRKKGIWILCSAMDGQEMYDLDLTGPIALVIGNEGSGVRPLIREKCDFTARIPLLGQIESLNASVAAGVLAYEIVRQRRG